jgi:hypothetical protein
MRGSVLYDHGHLPQLTKSKNPDSRDTIVLIGLPGTWEWPPNREKDGAQVTTVLAHVANKQLPAPPDVHEMRQHSVTPHPFTSGYLQYP